MCEKCVNVLLSNVVVQVDMKLPKQKHKKLDKKPQKCNKLATL